MTSIRRLVPYLLLPLSLVACALANAPWLRAFPAGVLAVPLFGAVLLSVLTPLVVVGVGVRRLWVSAVADVVMFVFYAMLVTLREPVGFHDLYRGLVHGPAQILSFALPLVSPRTLLVAPVALCWLSGALVGECLARGWRSVLPYLTLLVTAGLAYAATAHAVTNATDGRRYDTLLAAALLLTLLLLRTAQAWVAQDESAEPTAPEGILPLRGLGFGAVLAVAVAAAAALIVQSSAFAGRPETAARVPPVDQSRPLTPVAFVGNLRPENPKSKGTALFNLSVDRPSPNYVAMASVDYYDGDSWSFSRTFRPSGGVIPADSDPAMRPGGPLVTQQYRILPGRLTTVPWMPHVDRAQSVTGTSVNIDAASGMIVPARTLHAGEGYTVTSQTPRTTFDQLGRSALLGTSESQVDTTLANGLAAPLATLIASLSQETGTSSASPIAFLQAVATDFRTKDALAGGPVSQSTSTPTPSRTSSPSPSATPSAHTGGTTFADVLASIRATRAATPEQFATLTALIAREIGVPAVVVTGFRVPLPKGTKLLPAGSYSVTTAEAWTWVEIPVRGLGWVVLDPSPSKYGGAPETGGRTVPPSPSPSPSQTAQLTHSNNGGHAVAPRSRTPHATGFSTGDVVVIVLSAVLLAIVALLAFLLLRKELRTRNRRLRPDPRHRLIGAWQESVDLLAEAGISGLSHATSTEVVAATDARFGGKSAAQTQLVGEAANVAIFSPATTIGMPAADAAWQAHTQLRRSVRSQLTVRERARTRLRYNRARRPSLLRRLGDRHRQHR